MNEKEDYPDPEQYKDLYHVIFTNILDFKRSNSKATLRSKTNEGEEPPAILGNPSHFSVYASVRSTILCQWTNLLMSRFKMPTVEDFDELPPLSRSQYESCLPKVVNIGLKAIFSVISESRSIQSNICSKALRSLLDVLQGYEPEELMREPPEVLDSIFNMLIEICCGPGPGMHNPDDGSHMTSLACSCLVALVVARNNTSQLLKAISALLMSPEGLATLNIALPDILIIHQRIMQSLVLGRTSSAYWLTHGIPQKSLTDSFHLNIPKDLIPVDQVWRSNSIASDGSFLYIYSVKGLIKVGTGYGGTIKSHIYKVNPSIFNGDPQVWLGYHKHKIYAKTTGTNKLSEIDTNNLCIAGEVHLESYLQTKNTILFADSENIGTITPIKEDGLLLKLYNIETYPGKVSLTLTKKVILNLTKRYTYALGWATYEEPAPQKLLEPLELDSSSTEEDESEYIVAGQEFTLIRMNSGKVYFSGKASALSFKGTWSKGSKWNELTVGKKQKVINMAVGHEGQHAVLLTDDGQALFSGTARRGEDGDAPKTRRQPKAVKNKRFSKMENEVITNVACNYGSTALLTKKGRLYMFGKDTQHSDPNGYVKGLEDETLTQVALGKAHGAVLNNEGVVFTFGINNRGQCGRESNSSHKEATETSGNSLAQQQTTRSDLVKICEPGFHYWSQEICRLCTKCYFCTGMWTNTNVSKKKICKCSDGDSGCSICGICRKCANETTPLTSFEDSNTTSAIPKTRTLMNQSPRFSQTPDSHDEKKLRRNIHATSTPKSCKKLKFSSPSHSSKVCDDNASGSDIEREGNNRSSCLPPGAISFDKKVKFISCGLHHTVMLTVDGDVYTFGSNQFGQLGTGDTSAQHGIMKVNVPHCTQIAAGSNHTVMLTSAGAVYTMGYNNRGQLGRQGFLFSPIKSDPKNCEPIEISHLGPSNGCKAKWIGASADQTFIKLDQALISMQTLSSANITGNKISLVILPSQYEDSYKSITVNKNDGICNAFNDEDQADFVKSLACLDPFYDVMYQFVPEKQIINCYNIMLVTAKNIPQCSTLLPSPESYSEVSVEMGSKPHDDKKYISILSSELAIPKVQNCLVTRSHVALNLLACLDTFFLWKTSDCKLHDDTSCAEIPLPKHPNKEEYQMINRFISNGGGWGYSGHSIEAIRFMSDCDVILGGYGLYGGRGQYIAKIKLFDIGYEGGDQEGDGDLISESEEVIYRCPPREKYPVYFEVPVKIMANRWYVAWARVSGPSSDCGSAGQSSVASEGYIFNFKSSKKSNNGTDLNSGQIPSFFFKSVSNLTVPNKMLVVDDPVPFLSHYYGKFISKEGLDCLHSLLQWSWSKVIYSKIEANKDLTQHQQISLLKNQERLAFITKATLRLIKCYLKEIYPIFKKKNTNECENLVEGICEIRHLLMTILSENKPETLNTKNKRSYNNLQRLITSILDECHHTFQELFHIFFPTSTLKWDILCSLLSDVKAGVSTKQALLLSAVVASLGENANLRCILPLKINNVNENEESNNPILVNKINKIRGIAEFNKWQLPDALDRLIDLVTTPVKLALRQTGIKLDDNFTECLIKHSCHLLIKIVGELTFNFVNPEETEVCGSNQQFMCTPSRFIHFNPLCNWHTSKGFPDAICFKVDRPIQIGGVCLYGGLGNYNYELELLVDQSRPVNNSSSPQWRSLEYARGSLLNENDDIFEVRFVRPVYIQENVQHAIRLWNFGGPTRSGDQGITYVRGPDGTNFIYSRCPLSLNGTSTSRGQIPSLIYARYQLDQDSMTKSATSLDSLAKIPRNQILNVSQLIIRKCSKLLQEVRNEFTLDVLQNSSALENSHCLKTLLPMTFAHLSQLRDPESCVEVLGLLNLILPEVAALNHFKKGPFKDIIQPTTTSSHYVWVESDHPYKPASVKNYRVTFPSTVSWMVLEIDPRSGTAQPEDTLTIYIQRTSNSINKTPDKQIKIHDLPNMKLNELDWVTFYSNTDAAELDNINILQQTYVPITDKMSNQKSDWTQKTLIVPGNELVFSMETASDYVKDEKANKYGFKCLVVGYSDLMDVPSEKVNTNQISSLKKLEMEMAYLGGMCAAHLISPNVDIHSNQGEALVAGIDDDHSEMAMDSSPDEFEDLILSRGLAIEKSPTIHQALGGQISFSKCKEQMFLQDLIRCTSEGAGARLGRWLQPEPYVDARRCSLEVEGPVRCGEACEIRVLLRDQHGRPARAPGLLAQLTAEAAGIAPVPPSAALPLLNLPYQPTVKENMRFQCITMMKAFQMHSLEELRAATPTANRPKECLNVDYHDDGNITAVWDPEVPGRYTIQCSIDGYPFEESLTIDVIEPLEGASAPNPQPFQSVPIPNKTRKFLEMDSSGLRIRAFPSLQSEQIGLIEPGGDISFDDVIMNGDGVWLRLNAESIQLYCSNIPLEMEAWTLQFNHHVGRSLLYPNETPNMNIELNTTQTLQENKTNPQSPDLDGRFITRYKVIRMVEVRTSYMKESGVVGILHVNEKVSIKNTHTSLIGTWVLLDEITAAQYGFVSDTGECWILRKALESVLDDDDWPVEDQERKIIAVNRNVNHYARLMMNEDEQGLFPAGGRWNPIQQLPDKQKIFMEAPMLRNGNAGNNQPSANEFNQQREDHLNLEVTLSDEDYEKQLQYLMQAETQTSPQFKSSNDEQQLNAVNLSLKTEQLKISLDTSTEDVPIAVTPSQAESIRANFAAFLWHEGIVHDAMTCASYLKFHPTLPKMGSQVITRPLSHSPLSSVTQRHSVEVSNAGNYLNIQKSTLETLTRSALNANANRSRGKRASGAIAGDVSIIREEDVAGPSGEGNSDSKDIVCILPAAFRALLALWDSMADLQPLRSTEKKSDMGDEILSDKKGDEFRSYHESKKYHGQGKAKVQGPMLSGRLKGGIKALCELCSELVALPVSEHMLNCHKGCGGPSTGLGYSYHGIYMGGWFGLCGLPGHGYMGPGYVLCKGCREKYIKERMDHHTKSGTNASILINEAILDKADFQPTLGPTHTDYDIMRRNAMFLLEISSAAETDDVNKTVSEERICTPFFPPPPYQCLDVLHQLHPITNEQRLQEMSHIITTPIEVAGVNGNDGEAQKITPEGKPSTSGMGIRVHRSVSMGQDTAQIFPPDVTLRKRNKSHGGSSLLCHPSAALQALVGLNPEETAIHGVSAVAPLKVDRELLMSKPVIMFLTKQKDITKLRKSMINSVRVGAMKKYGLEAMNWLLHSVTQPTSLHDLMWWFNHAMNQYHPTMLQDEPNVNVSKNGWQESMAHLGHSMSCQLRDSLHGLLQSISDLMPLLPLASPLLLQAVRCWALDYNADDHVFLHRSQVFNNISKILSRSEEEINDDMAVSLNEQYFPSTHYDNAAPEKIHERTQIWSCKDITIGCEVQVSSRQAMIESLTDGSTETFWESGEEDRTKPKWVQLSCPANIDDTPSFICLHVDNTRDPQNKVLLVSFLYGPNSDELQHIKDYDANIKTSGWIFCSLPYIGRSVVIRCEVRGPDASVRIRQMRALGQPWTSLAHQQPPTHITLQRYTEVETLRVFRLITGQVFGKLIDSDLDESGTSQRSGENNDLKEHMVGILFSRNKLSSLQKQVMVHILSAIGSEAQRAREMWESMDAYTDSPVELNNAEPGATVTHTQQIDDYCFEMLSMVLALSGSRLGRSYLSEHLVLIRDLLSLLHTGTARVQRQVIAVLRRMIGEVTPQRMTVALASNVPSSPSVTFIDHLISCISKALTVQVKMKAGQSASVWAGQPSDQIVQPNKPTMYSVTMRTSISTQHPNLWFLKGSMSHKHAKLVAELLGDMIQGKMSEQWAQTTKVAIAENIFTLTNLNDRERGPDPCMTLPSLWRALGSLCALDEYQVERLNARGWTDLSNLYGTGVDNGPIKLDPRFKPTDIPRPLCVNHDDGETYAIIECQVCGAMCQECDRFLHLHRRTRHHQRQICKEEETAIRVDLHEGCGRVKLFWLLALVDQRTLKTLVEFRGTQSDLGNSGWKGTPGVSIGVCRFCNAQSNSGLLAIGNLCAEPDCQEYSKTACVRILVCGHACGGVRDEQRCLPCLHGCVAERSTSSSPLEEAAGCSTKKPILNLDSEDMCIICFTEPLPSAPCIQLTCGHVFHLHCVRKILMKKWVGPRITFAFSKCPLCKVDMVHTHLDDLLKPIRALQEEVKRKALVRLEYEGLKDAAAIATRYHNVAAEYAMHRYAYYVCCKCNKAYYGGEARCDAEGGDANIDFNPQELVCGGCSDVARAQMCPKHGADFLEYKCRFCCSVAVFFCLGDTHFCNGCHEEFQRLRKIPVALLPQCPAGTKGKQLEGNRDDCPLRIRHPPTGTEFALGCGICRNSHTF